MTDRWISVQDAATMAGVSRRTVYNWWPKLAPEDKRLTISGHRKIRAWSWLTSSQAQVCGTCEWWATHSKNPRAAWGECEQPDERVIARDLETRKDFSCQTWKAKT